MRPARSDVSRLPAPRAAATAAARRLRAGRTVLGFGLAERPATHLEAVRLLDRVLRLTCRHVNECKAARPACFAIVDELDGIDFAVALEEAAHFVFRRGERQVANVDRRHSTDSH